MLVASVGAGLAARLRPAPEEYADALVAAVVPERALWRLCTEWLDAQESAEVDIRRAS